MIIFKWPVSFDENEWGLLAALLILIIVSIALPKRFPAIVTFLIMLFNAFLGTAVDFILATEYPFDFYDTFDTPKYDFMDFLMYKVVYPLFGYISLYFYDKWHIRGRDRLRYMAVWVAVSVTLEALASYLHVFTYKNWNLYYSAISYLVIFWINLSFFRLIHFGMEQIRKTSDNP